MVQLTALGVQNPQIDALGAFKQGVAGAAGLDEAKRSAAEKTLQLVGAASMHALGGNINGEADPQKYEEGLNMLADMGLRVDQFRGKPYLANTAARASVTTMQQLQLAQNEKEFGLALERFGHMVSDADRNYALDQQRLDLDRQRIANAGTPSGYRRTEAGEFEAIPGGPADPSNPLNTRKVTGPALSATAQKELFEADEAVQAGESVISSLNRALEINSKAYSGPLARQRGYGASLFGSEGGEVTEELANLVTTQALDQLKAVFGAMPTEGERKILLEIQGSVDKAPEVRKVIYERAVAMAEKRIAFNRQKAQQLRSGEYFTEGPGDFSQPTAEPAAPDGTGSGEPIYATNPTTKERLMLQNGQWVPVQ